MNNNKEELVRQIRAIGESLMKNAESIVGDEKYLSSIKVTASVGADNVPAVDVSRTFYPERWIEVRGVELYDEDIK